MYFSRNISSLFIQRYLFHKEIILDSVKIYVYFNPFSYKKQIANLHWKFKLGTKNVLSRAGVLLMEENILKLSMVQ